MYEELERHFLFWNEKIAAVHNEAMKAIEEMEDDQVKHSHALHELQHNMHSLMPKCTKALQENKEIELQLINMNEYHLVTRFKDAVFIRLKNNQLRDKMVQDVQVKRKVTMEKEKHLFNRQQRDTMKELLYTVQQALNKMISQRRKEFEK